MLDEQLVKLIQDTDSYTALTIIFLIYLSKLTKDLLKKVSCMEGKITVVLELLKGEKE